MVFRKYVETNSNARAIELLSPARNAECGREAILHGADAVYIGGPAFGARAAAGNSVDDIAGLCRFAHFYGARVYVTFNTILYDHELADAERVVWQLYRAGVDALIVQDLALLRLSLPPIALHASTQMDNRTPEKAQWLEKAGFEQIVVARELSLSQIKSIATAVAVPVEAFVHGALCVSYSGRCYASQSCFGRSANRGECAQFCRLAFDLVDAGGKTLARHQHLLSLRDMNRQASLEMMLDAGVRSLKIEGRLKDVEYVKNVTAFYRRRLDEIMERRPADYRRASLGHSHVEFIPDVSKSFNRGFTEYFLHGRTSDVWDFSTPKMRGEYVGRVSELRKRSFVLADVPPHRMLEPGDGFTYDSDEGLGGFRANRVEGHEVFPHRMPPLRRGQKIYRNLDARFEHQLQRPTAVRRIRVDFEISTVEQGFRVSATDEVGRTACETFGAVLECADKPQTDTMTRQFSRLGDTPYELGHFSCPDNYFVPASLLAQWRRVVVEKLMAQVPAERSAEVKPVEPSELPQADKSVIESLSVNVSNRLAHSVLKEIGAEVVEPAFEIQPRADQVLMTCRHCLRYAFGQCVRKQHVQRPWREPLTLRISDGREFLLRFDCKNCVMEVVKKLPGAVAP